MSARLDPTTSPVLKPQQLRGIPEIPPEIFHEIFSYFGPAAEYESSVYDIIPRMTTRNRAIQNMGLLCRDFYHHVFPLLFENIYAAGSGVRESEEEPMLHCEILCRNIVAGDEQARRIATYTKRFAIVDLHMGKKYQAAPGTPETERDLSIFSKALGYMANLKELYLCNMSITDNLLRSAICLAPLNVLRLENCNIPKSLDAELLANFSTRVHVNHVYAEQNISYGDTVPYDQFTRHLCLSRTEHFTSDVGVEGHILRGLAASASPMQSLQDLHLEIIHIDKAHPELISNVLALMPALKSLHIAEVYYRGGHWDLDMELASRFKPCSSYPKLPHLVHVYAPLYAVQTLVPGSNASSVGFSYEYFNDSNHPALEYASDEEFWQDCAISLHESKYYMSRLHIPVAFYWTVPFADYFPELRQLALHTAHCNWNESSFWWPPEKMVIKFLDSWDTHPKLDKIEFIYNVTISNGRGSPACISLSDDTTNSLKEKIPTLKELKFIWSNTEEYVDMSKFVAN